MSDPSFKRVEELFQKAVELEPGQRSTFLDSRCAGDLALRAAVEELLKHDDGAGATASILASPLARGETGNDPSSEGPMARTAADPNAPALPTLPGYELFWEIGRGGMGVVYKARQLSLNRPVALKMLLTGAPNPAARLARFRTEAEALARLHHPNIVQIYEIGEYEGRPFFALELVPGPNLAQILKGQPHGARAAAQLTEVLARSVHFAHQRGILHRDLKPANILMQKEAAGKTRDEKGPSESTCILPPNPYTPKITDFGLAKFIGTGEQDAEGEGSPALTRTGAILGTPCYMAPEQARGTRKDRDLGPAADIYALGAILYELLTGRPPFQGETALETLRQLTSEGLVPPRRLQSKTPRDLECICLKCLEKEPKNRYRSALDLAEDLRRFQEGRPIRARPVGTLQRIGRWCRRRPVVAGLLALSAALAIALIVSVLVYNARLMAAAQKESEERRLFLVQLNLTLGMRSLDEGDCFTGLLLLTEALALDADHTEQDRQHRTRVATVLRQCPRLVQLQVYDGQPLCIGPSPPDSWMVAVPSERDRVRVKDVLTGQVIGPELEPRTPVVMGAFRADGRLLATADKGGTVQVWEVASGRAAAPPLPQGGPVDRLALHPSGILLTRRTDFLIQTWDVASGKIRPLQGLPEGPPQYADFSDDGRWVLIVGADQSARIWDAATGKVVGRPLASSKTVNTGAISSDGSRIALAGMDGGVQVWEAATGKPVRGLLRTDPVRSITFNRAANRIITVGDGHTAQIWNLDRDGRFVPALRHESIIQGARFGARDRLVVTFSSDNTARVWDAVTGETVTPPLRHNGSVTYAGFNADGRQVLTAGKGGIVRLWELAEPARIHLGKKEELATPTARAETDGRRLRMVGNTILVIDAVTGAPLGQPLRHGSVVTHAAFSSTGRLVVTTSDDNTARVWDARSGNLLLPPLMHKGNVINGAFSADDSRLITASEDQTARVWDVATGKPLTPPLKHPGKLLRTYFGPDNNRAFTVDRDGGVCSWDLTPDTRPLSTLKRLAQVLSGTQVDPTHGLVPLDGEGLRSAWSKLQTHPLADD